MSCSKRACTWSVTVSEYKLSKVNQKHGRTGETREQSSEWASSETQARMHACIQTPTLLLNCTGVFCEEEFPYGRNTPFLVLETIGQSHSQIILCTLIDFGLKNSEIYQCLIPFRAQQLKMDDNWNRNQYKITFRCHGPRVVPGHFKVCTHHTRMQPSTLSSWSHWPRGPVDLKSYWPPKKSTGPQFFSNDVNPSKTVVDIKHYWNKYSLEQN